jgi:hypothetical protein
VGGAPPAIELRLKRIGDLFDPLDPFPIPTRDLAPNAETFIIGWAREIQGGAPVSLVVHVPEAELMSSEAGILAEAISRHFAARAQFMQGEQDELFRNGRRALAIGLAVLAICIAISTVATAFLGDTPVAQYLSEGVIIFGWVANWRPAEIFLYDWWPIAQRKRLFQRLAAAPMEIKAY